VVAVTVGAWNLLIFVTGVDDEADLPKAGALQSGHR
jgi:hypothetical protein